MTFTQAISRIHQAVVPFIGSQEPAKGYPDWATSIRGMFGLDQRTNFSRAYRLVGTFAACIDLIAEDLAALPVVFEYRARTRKGRAVRIERERGNIVDVWQKGDPLDTGFEVRRDELANRLGWGISYMLLDRMRPFDQPQSGPPSEIRILPSQYISFIKGPRRTVQQYEWQNGGSSVRLQPESLIAIRTFNPDDELEGMPVLASLTYQCDIRQDIGRLVREYLRGGGMPAGLFTSDRKQSGPMFKSEQDHNDWILKMRERHSGIDKIRDPIALEGVTYQRVGLTLAELMVLQISNLTDLDICRRLRVPPWKIGIKDSSAFGAGSEADERGYVENCLMKHAALRDEVYNERLCPLFGERIEMRTDFSKLPTMQSIMLDQSERVMRLTGRPLVTLDGGLEMLDLPASGDPTGGIYPVPFSLAPAELVLGARAMERPPAPAAPGNNPPPADQPADEPAPASQSRIRVGQDAERAELRRGAAVSLLYFERRMGSAMVQLFDGWEAATVRAIEENFSHLQRRAAGGNGHVRQAQVDVDQLLALLFAGAEEKVAEILAGILKTQGQAAMSAVVAGLEYRIQGERARAYIEHKTARLLTQTSLTTEIAVRDALTSGFAAAETLDQVIARVRQAAFSNNQARALMVARTESAGAYNFATFDAWQAASDVVEGKQWLDSNDEAVRDTHAAADGQVVAISAPFLVGDASLMFPGDSSYNAPAGEIINCRCTMLAELAPKRLKWIKPRNRIASVV